jgi:type II secretory pathway component PulF
MNIEYLMMGKKKGASMVGGLIGLMIVVLILVVAVLPTVANTISNGNFTGTTATLMNLIPILLAILGVVVVVGYMKFS